VEEAAVEGARRAHLSRATPGAGEGVTRSGDAGSPSPHDLEQAGDGAGEQEALDVARGDHDPRGGLSPRHALHVLGHRAGDRFGIVGKKDLYPNQLSGGQQQLVGVARAVIANPKLILADEPTGNLHSTQGEAIMDLFKRLNREGTTIIQVTHNEEYARYASRIIQLRDGWIVEE